MSHVHIDWSVNGDRPALVAHLEREHEVTVSDGNRHDPDMHGAYERLHLTMHGAAGEGDE